MENRYVTIIAIALLLTSLLLSGCMQTVQNEGQMSYNVTGNQNAGAAVAPNNNSTTEPAVANLTNSTNSTIIQAQNNSACQANSIYFIYADWCPHCQKMKPWVADLESKGYKFVKVSSDKASSVADCLAGIAKMQYIPEFDCISTKESHVGEFDSEDALKAFADSCGALH